MHGPGKPHLLFGIAIVVTLGCIRSIVGDAVSIHGSGTTNPSKCIWLLMSQIMDQTKLLTHLTYRAVGSSTGQKEFIGADNDFIPYNDFGSGDIPISTSDYDKLTNASVGIVHLPFVLGAISLFHSVPGVPAGPSGLNLTSCLIAKIFKREIIYWDDDEIVAKNPGLRSVLPHENYEINVARRVKGSSSTASVTEYLHESCDAEWPIGNVGKEIAWDTDTMKCEGSGGMTDCIRNFPGTIGYIDSGHGHSQNLVEIELENADGTFLSSKEAAEKGGIGAAASSVPSSADLDFGHVKLLNKPGTYTWPIVAMSYIYVRKDLSFLASVDAQSLLVAFLRMLYDKDSIGQCSQFGFTPVPSDVRNVALDGIGMLQVAEAAPTWTVEVNTTVGAGQGDYVISQKRRTYSEYERSVVTGDISALEDKIASLEATIAQMKLSMNGASNVERSSLSNDGDDNDGQVRVSLALGIISLILSLAALGWLTNIQCCRKYE